MLNYFFLTLKNYLTVTFLKFNFQKTEEHRAYRTRT